MNFNTLKTQVNQIHQDSVRRAFEFLIELLEQGPEVREPCCEEPTFDPAKYPEDEAVNPAKVQIVSADEAGFEGDPRPEQLQIEDAYVRLSLEDEVA